GPRPPRARRTPAAPEARPVRAPRSSAHRPVSRISRPDFVMYATRLTPPSAADTCTRSISSPWTNSGPVPAEARTVKLAVAVSTAGWLVGMARLAVALDELRVPASVALVDVTASNWPWARIDTTVPGGMLAADSATFTGFVVVVGSVMSGL